MLVGLRLRGAAQLAGMVMSVRVMTAVFDRYPSKGAGEMLLALALADVARDDGVLMINGSVPDLARKTRQTDRGVQLQLRRMQAIGWLHVVRESDGGRGRCSAYRIDAAWLGGADLPDRPSAETVNCATTNGELSSPSPQAETVNWTTRNGELSSPSYEPLIPNTEIPPNPPLPAKGGKPSTVKPNPKPEPTPVMAAKAGPARGKPKEAGTRSRPASPALSLKAWLAACAERGEQPVPEGHAVFGYCDRVGIGREILALHWAEFKTRRSESGKRQADWRKTFHNSVRDNWFRLWFIPAGQSAQLTTVGRQALATHGGPA